MDNVNAMYSYQNSAFANCALKHYKSAQRALCCKVVIMFLLSFIHIHSPLPRLLHLEDSRYHCVWHSSAVLVPLLTILSTTPSLISPSSVNKQHGHEEEVRVRQDAVKPTGHAIGKALIRMKLAAVLRQEERV